MPRGLGVLTLNAIPLFFLVLVGLVDVEDLDGRSTDELVAGTGS